MQKAIQEFTQAFANLITKITQQPDVVPTSALHEMPKNFSDWLQKFDIMKVPGDGLLLTVLNSVSCTKWSPTVVEFCLMAAVDGAEAALPLIKDLLANSFGFTGNVLLKKPAAAKAKVAAPAAPKVTVDDVQKAAVTLCTKFKDKARVYAIIQQFGAEKIEAVDPAKLGDLKAALEAAMETSPQMAESADEPF